MKALKTIGLALFTTVLIGSCTNLLPHAIDYELKQWGITKPASPPELERNDYEEQKRTCCHEKARK